MLEGVASAILGKILGDYVTGFESKNLKFSFSGELELSNLQLKRSALDGLDLPISIKSGFLSKLFLSVPWRSLGSQPAIIRIEKIFVLVGPATVASYDDAELERRAQAEKQRKLEINEAVKLGRLEARLKAQQNAGKPETESDSFTKRLLTNLINSLQIFIDQIHIRYEDDITVPGKSFSAGITLNKLHGKSTDENWEPSLSSSATAKFIFKLLQLQDLSLYWNPKDEFIKWNSPEELASAMEKLIPKPKDPTSKAERKGPKHTYILEPCSSENKLVAAKSDLPTRGIPKYRSELHLDKLGLSLREDQYDQVAQIMQRAKLFRTAVKYRKHKRPTSSVSKDPKAWWNFAVRCVVGDIRDRHSRWRWETMKQRRSDRLAYVDLWQKKLAKKGKALDKPDAEALKKLEEWLSYEDIVYFRSLAEVQLRRKEQRQQALSPSKPQSSYESYTSISSWTGWASGFFARGKPPAPAGVPASAPAAPMAVEQQHPEETTLFGVKLSEEDWGDIYRAVMTDDTLADEDDDGQTKPRLDKPPADWVRIEAAVHLDNVQVELKDYKGSPIAGISLRNVSANAALRDQWKTFSAELASLQISDPSTKGSLFPILIEPQFEYERRAAEQAGSALATSKSEKLFRLRFDIDPESPSVDYAIDVQLAQLNIIYNYSFIRRVGGFFSAPYASEAAEEKAQTRGWSLTSRRQQLLFLVERKSTVYLNLDINAPNVLVPQDPTSKTSPMVVLVLGRATMRTVLASATSEDLTKSVGGTSSPNLDSTFYDVFSLRISNLQAIIAKTENFDAALRSDSTALQSRQLLQPFDFGMELAICKINVEQLANLRLRFALPSLRAFLPSRRLRRFMNILFQAIYELTGTATADPAEEPNVVEDLPAPPPVLAPASVAEALEETEKMPSEESSPKGIFLDLSLTAPDISLKLSDNDSKKRRQDIAWIHIQGFTTAVRRTELVTSVDISLRTLKIDDLMQPWGTEFNWLADSTISDLESQSIWKSPSDNASKLIVFHLEILDHTHPNYALHGTDRFCELKFNTLSLNFNRETWAKFIKFMPNFAGGADPVTAAPAPASSVPRSVSSLKRSSSSALLRKSSKRDSSKRPSSVTIAPESLKPPVKATSPPAPTDDSIRFKMSISIHAIQLSLNDDGKCLSVWALSDSFAEVTTRPSTLAVQGHLGAFKVRDLSAAARYSHVLAIRGSRMVDFKFTMTKSEPGEIGPEPLDVSFLFLQFNSLRLVVNSKFVFEMLRFILVFVSMLSTTEPNSAEIGAPAQPEELSNEPPTSVFKYHIKLLNPILTFPENEKSSNIIITDLGEIDVQNSFYFLTDPNEAARPSDVPPPPTLMEELSVSVRALNAQTGVFKDDHLNPNSRVLFQRALLHNTDIFLQITRPWKTQAQQFDPSLMPLSIPDSRIDISIPALKFIANPEQLTLLFHVLRDNWFYTPSEKDVSVALKLNVEAEAARDAALKKQNTHLKISHASLLTTTSIMNLEIGLLSLDCRDHCNIFSMQRAPKLCAATIDHTQVAIQTYSNESMNIDFDIQSIVLRDIREDSPIAHIRERRMFVKPLLDENVPQVRGKWLRQSNGHQELQARIDQVRIIAVPPVFSKFSANVSPVIPQLMEVLAKRSSIIEKTMTPNQLKKVQELLDLQQREKKIGFEAKITLPSAELYFLENLGSIPTRSIILSTSGSVHYKQFGNDQDYEIALVDLQVFKSLDYASSSSNDGSTVNLTESEDAVLLLNPTDLTFTYAARLDSVDMHLATPAKTIKLVVSYGDFKLMTMILAQWATAEPESDSAPSSDRLPRSSSQSDLEATPSSSDMDDVTDADTEDDGISRTSLDLPIAPNDQTLTPVVSARERPSKSASSPTVAPPKSQRFGMNKSKFDIVVIDDVDGVDTPLFEVKLALTAPVAVSNWSTDFHTAVQSRGAIDYYNSRLAAWEPLMEPWDFDLTIHGVRWCLSSNTVMNMNITKALINSVRAALKAWSADFYGSAMQAPKTPANFPRELIEHRYYIRNNTGISMAYWIVGANGQSVSSKQTLAPGHENGLPQLVTAAVVSPQPAPTPQKGLVRTQSLIGLPRKRLDRSAMGRQIKSAAKPQLHANLQGFSDVVISNFDQIGKFAIPLSSGEGRNLVYEVQNRFGAKVIAFTSPVLVKNATSYAIQIGWEKSGANTERRLFVLPSVEPGKTIPVPLEMVFDGSLRFRPAVTMAPTSDETAEQARLAAGTGADSQRARDNPYRWSSVKCECSSLHVGTRPIPCLSKSSDSQPFLFVGTVEHATTENGIHSRDQFVLKACPPIIIENLLAHKLKYKVLDKASGDLVYQGAINKGQRADIHTVKPNQELYMQIKLHGYGWTDRELITSSASSARILAGRFVLHDEKIPDRTLQLNVDNAVSADGIRVISIYCLFWIINKTGLPLGVTSRTTRSRTSIDSLDHDVNDPDKMVLYDGEVRDWFYSDLLDESPQMYYPATYQSGKFYFRLGPSTWSKGVNLNTQNANTVLEIEEKKGVGSAATRQRLFEVALSIYPAQNKFWKTRIITLAPRYIIHNKTQHTIFFRQKGSEFISSLLTQEKIPFQWPDKTKEKRVRIRLNVPHCSWSGEIDLSDIDRYPLRLYDSKTGRIYIVRVRLNLFVDQGITVLTLEDEQMQRPLYRVDNLTQEQILLKQKEVGLPEVIPPRSRHAWSWHEPTKTYLVEASFNSKQAESLVLSFAKVKSYPSVKFKNGQGRTISIRVEMKTDKFTRVLVFIPEVSRKLKKRSFVASGLPRQVRSGTSSTPSTPPSSSRSLPTSPTGSSSNLATEAAAAPSSSKRQLLARASQDGGPSDSPPGSTNTSSASLEVVPEDSKERFKLELKLDRVGLSVVDEKNEELIYVTVDDLQVEYVLTGVKQSIELLIKDCQIDNQLSSTYFPALLYSPVREPPHFFKLAIIKSLEQKDLDYYNYVSVLCRELFLQLDEEIVIKLLGFIDVTLESFEDTSGDAVGHKFDVMSLGAGDDDEKMTYNEIFHLNPFKFNLSFLSHGRDDSDQSSSNGRSNNRANLSSILLAIPEKLIPNVEYAPIGLKGLLLRHSFTTSSELYQRIAEHYRRQLLQELLKILGSFDALGSPVSLVQNLGTGVKDLFYEPAKGITISPKEFGKGLGKGGKSFIKKTVYGLFNSASKVVGTIGTGVAMMSFDESYQRERAESKRREKPKNALFGLGYGLKEFGEGLIKGVAGIVYQPIKGAQEDGAAGFFKGVGQGLIGVVVKPTVGALDMVQRTTEGIKNTTSSADQNRKRRRPPRFIDRDRVLRIYDVEKAQMQSLLHQLESGSYKKHKYSTHIYLDNLQVQSSSSSNSPRADQKHLRFFLISNKVVFFLARTKLDWRIWLEDLVEVRKEVTATKATITLIYKKSDSLQESPDLGAKQVDVVPAQVEAVVAALKDQWHTYRATFRAASPRSESTQ